MDKRVDRSEYEDELRSRSIVKASEGEIYDAALSFGKKISEETQNTLSARLKQAINENGVEGAIKYCNVRAYPLVDSLKKNYNVEIKRVSMKVRNPKDAPDSIERKILEAYHYNADRNLPLEENIQKLNGDEFLFNKPIVINNPLCLNCHGTIGGEVSENTYALIKDLYPEDSAFNYKMGDLRGMWSIRIPQQEVIRQKLQ